MHYKNSAEKLKALPVQLIDHPEGVIIKRGCVEINVAGRGARTAVTAILSATTNSHATHEDICGLFPSAARDLASKLIEQLIARRILSSGTVDLGDDGVESSLDIFYWHFNESSERVSGKWQAKRFAIVGVNCVSRQIATALSMSGMRNVEIVDYPLLRNLRLFDDSGELKDESWPLSMKPVDYCQWIANVKAAVFDCVVATSDFGLTSSFQEWNELCVQHHHNFFPVVLDNLIGYIGPLTVPGETACYDCLRARENSNMDVPYIFRAKETVAFEGQVVVGFHPSMASVLGEIACFELIKLYSEVLPTLPAHLLEVNLLASRLTCRKVLKIPRCRTCSSLNKKASTNGSKVVLSRGDLKQP